MILLNAVVVRQLRKAGPNALMIVERLFSGDFGRKGAHLTVATRNVRHFAPTGVPGFDPFKARA